MSDVSDPSNGAGAVLFAWELGGGLGHVAKGLLLAGQLAAQDTEVSFAVRDLAITHPLLPDASHRLYQAPVSWRRLQDAPAPACHAELLLHAGFGDSAALRGLVRGWLTLFEADRTRLVIADHAPSAVLAARCAGLPVVLFGHGFFAPPPGWPVFRTWDTVPAERTERAQRQVLACVNDCLGSFGATPVDTLSALSSTSTSFLATWPELDHYRRAAVPAATAALNRPQGNASPPPGSDTYIGTLWIDHVGGPADWPGGGDAPHRVFAYLRPGLPGLGAVLLALQRSGASVLVAAPGIAADVIAHWQGPRLRFTGDLVALRGVARDADLVVCSGSDTLHGLAQSGVPVLGLPLHAEQRIAAVRVAQTGAGRWLAPGSDVHTVLEAVRDLLDAPHYREAARRLQARCPRRELTEQLAPVVDTCLALLRGGTAVPSE